MQLVIGISGASGAILGISLLQALKEIQDCVTHLVITDDGAKTIEVETGMSLGEVSRLAHFNYPVQDMTAAIASGSFLTDGMIVIPCSMKTVSAIACGYSSNLLVRAADVCLKEKRKLVLVARESPLNGIHLQNMLTIQREGGIILPPVLSFYHHPASIQDLIDHIIGKVLSHFDLQYSRFRRWEPPQVHEPDKNKKR